MFSSVAIYCQATVIVRPQLPEVYLHVQLYIHANAKYCQNYQAFTVKLPEV